MAATVSFTCPECKAQLKGPAAMQGKKARCKKCEHVFILKANAPASSPPPAPKGKTAKPSPPAPKTAPTAPKKPSESGAITYSFKDEDAGKGEAAASEVESKSRFADNNPYDVTELDLTPRCPFCAKELESEDSVICLHCGYNNQTRTSPAVARTYANTSGEIMLWLSPGIACVLGCLALGGAIAYLWLGLDPKNPSDTLGLIRASQIWGSVISAFAIFFAGRFAIKRLILHPTPPEMEKK